MKNTVHVILGLSAITMMGGCASVNLPEVDFFKLPEYKEAQKDAAYPKAGDAPQAPTELRSDAAWDEAAKKLIASRDGFVAPESGMPERTPEDVRREFEALKAKVNAYKKDDPQ